MVQYLIFGSTPNKIYTTGQSMGGMTSFHLSIEYPDFFAAYLFVGSQWNTSLLSGLEQKNFFYVVSAGDPKASAGQAELLALFDADGAAYSHSEWSAQDDAETQKAAVAAMLAEAEKYLNFPYVWGGSSPSTSFDCSGFVSYVCNNCGVGWNFGRLGASGLLGICTRISAAEARPGDLIFFERTYDTTGASHVGIYVGDGMMLHCGDPIQYTSINTSYWQSHFLSFGRLPNP